MILKAISIETKNFNNTKRSKFKNYLNLFKIHHVKNPFKFNYKRK